MKRTQSFTTPAVGCDDREDFDDEPGYFKDVWFADCDELPDETQIASRLRHAFTSAGYRVTRVEEVEAPPVIIVNGVRREAQRITDYRMFFKHIQKLLRGAGFRLRKNELSVDQKGNRILAAFLSGKPAPNFEDILRERQENLADNVDVPL